MSKSVCANKRSRVSIVLSSRVLAPIDKERRVFNSQ